jgi:hypothetical protein
MKDAYSAKDLVYEKMKGIYSEELKGPTLRHFDEIKKRRECK